MASQPRSIDSTINNTSSSSRKLVYLALVFAPLVYILVFVLLESRTRIGQGGTSQPNEALMWVLGLLVPAFLLVYLYVLLIPAIKKNRIGTTFATAALIIAIGDDAIAIMCVVIGVMQYTATGEVPWVPVLALVLVAIMHGLYLYLFRVVPMDQAFVKKNDSNKDMAKKQEESP